MRCAALSVLCLFFFFACSSGKEKDSPSSSTSAPTGHVDVTPERASLATMQSSPEVETAAAHVDPDGYSGWSAWCEPMYYESQCEVDSDCADQDHPALRGAPLKCLHPWWASKDSDLRICAPGGASKTERRWRTARLRELVSQLYFDEPERCGSWAWDVTARPGRARQYERRFEDGRGVGRQHFRCQREWRAAEQLAGFLSVPYQREVSKRPYKRHRLDPDQAANAKAYVKEAGAYGWIVELGCEKPGRSAKNCPKYRSGPRKGQRMLYIKDTRPKPGAQRINSHFEERWRWEYGLGMFGKNVAYGLQDWDVLAPPEVLCLEVPSVESYLRDVRWAVHVYRGNGVQCGGQTYRGHALRKSEDPTTHEETVQEVDEPSWIDVHRVASAGAWCPKTGPKAAKMRRNFVAAMQAQGIDANAPVTEGEFGRPLPRDGQWDRAREVLSHLDAVLPSPWEAAETVDTAASVDAASP